jgi:hypothetical protein
MRFVKWFKRELPPEEQRLQVSEQLGALAKELGVDSPDVVISDTAAILNFLAVLCGSGDGERLHDAGFITQRFATEALEQYAEPEPAPEETLRRLIERGIDIACGAMYARNWKVVSEGLAKLVFLDELAKKVASGEEVLRDRSQESWPDVIE